jgi:hypothetical protein
MTATPKTPNRILFVRLFYGLTLLFLLFRLKNQMLLSQLQQPELTYLGNDITYIFLDWLGITDLLGQNFWIGLLLDISLFATTILSLIFTRQRITSILFTIILLVYIVAGYSFLCFHKHNLTGLWYCSLIFWFVDEAGFTLSFELVRYYCLFTYASAGFWKFFRGVWDAKGHFALVVKNDALAYLVQHPDSTLGKTISWLIAHPFLLDNLMLVACFAQLAFIIGFFTKKLDWFFLLFALAFHLMSLLLLRASFIEFAVILITLLPISYLYRKSPEA